MKFNINQLNCKNIIMKIYGVSKNEMKISSFFILWITMKLTLKVIISI